MTNQRRQNGFSLMEAVVATALLGIVTVLATTVMVNIASNRAPSQFANVELANSIRLQLSRRSPLDPTTACTTNLVGRPGAYTGTAPIAVQLAPGGAVVRAGAALNDWHLNVQSLEVRNITSAGPTNGGNTLYFGDVVLATQSQDAPGTSVQMREVAVARLAMEVQGGTNLVSCYANDVDEDTTDQLPSLCGLMTAPTGATGVWDGTRCRVTDATPPTTCASLGGTFSGSACAFHSETFVITRTIPPGSPGGGVGYQLTCPAGTLTVAGACHGVGFYETPFATILLYGPIASQPGLFACAWLPASYPPGNESVPYNIYAVCLR